MNKIIIKNYNDMLMKAHSKPNWNAVQDIEWLETNKSAQRI